MKEIGVLLKRAREESGKTLDDVANDTKIRKKYLKGIEEGDFNIIPGGEVYIKGFIKNYAGSIGLDGDEVIEKYKELKESLEEKGNIFEKETDNEYLRKSAKTKIETQAINSSKFFLFLFSIMIVVIAIVLVIKIKPALEVKPSNEINNQENQEDNGNIILDEEQEPNNSSVQEEDPKLNKISETSREIYYSIDRTPILEINVEVESCWIRIEVDNLRVAEETLYEGDERQWTGNEKIYILAGNPRAIELKLNGIKIGTSYNEPRNFFFEKIE